MRKGRKAMKKTYSGYKRVMRRIGKINRAVHSFKREVNLGTISTEISSLGTITNYNAGYNFKLQDCPNYAEYQALYDQYKITGINFKIMPKTDNVANAANSNTVSGFGQIITVIDYDDSVVSGLTRDDFLQFQTVKVTGPTRKHTRFLKPKQLGIVYRASGTTGQAVVPARFLDMGLADIPHFGVKVWIDGPTRNPLLGANDINSPLTVIYDVYATYYFKCKNTR